MRTLGGEGGRGGGVRKEQCDVSVQVCAFVLYSHCECVLLEIVPLRHRCELIRGFAGGPNEPPKIDVVGRRC